ncbi:XRE family transcriptional regulator [Streptomyces sp. NWU339]|uniref:ImmA/IrrE family metallo-endopeptidase n=1 Tax=Streptomyces sp. NWU339 TaxID=2185284 RepID=UPI000D676F3E|nr:ImmA/IrrE family metallo-endopeptidase [Streptomyces sp. NWU339]PWI06875.1 XRE family transcriptional regulator [Streptomyces sp. NWU339]
MTALVRERALSAATIAIELNSWLETLFELPHPCLPSCSHLEAEAAAQQVRAAWALGQDPIPNVIHLIESYGVRVFSLPSDCLEVGAFSTIAGETPFIFLASRESGERLRFDAAHELGHLILHDSVPRSRDPEIEADDFASAFLMPHSGLLAQRLKNAPIDRILSAKRRWGVSAIDLTRRLRRLDLLPGRRYNQAVNELTRRGYRRTEPDSLLARESSLLLTYIFKELRNGLEMSPADLATELNVHPTMLSECVNGLVPLGLDGGGEHSASLRPKFSPVRD